MEEELKTLREMTKPWMLVTTPSQTKPLMNGVLVSDLRAEAVKRVKSHYPDCNLSFGRCKGCERDIWFNNLTEEDLE